MPLSCSGLSGSIADCPGLYFLKLSPSKIVSGLLPGLYVCIHCSRLSSSGLPHFGILKTLLLQNAVTHLMISCAISLNNWKGPSWVRHFLSGSEILYRPYKLSHKGSLLC